MSFSWIFIIVKNKQNKTTESQALDCGRTKTHAVEYPVSSYTTDQSRDMTLQIAELGQCCLSIDALIEKSLQTGPLQYNSTLIRELF